MLSPITLAFSDYHKNPNKVSQQIELLLELSQAAWLDGALNDLLTRDIIEHMFKLGQDLDKESELYQQYKIALCIIGSGNSWKY